MNDYFFCHIGYVVRDMHMAIKRFEKEGGHIVIPPTEDRLQRVSVCLLRLDGCTDIELVAPLDPENSPVKGRLARGGGLDHICYYVPDLDLALKREEERGAIIVCPPTYAVAFKRQIAFVHRKSGLVVELMEK